jgi:exodeoxyribonuclease-3
MKLATWNVNSLRVRLPQVLDWLTAHHPDVLCLQETKLPDKDFPASELRAAGYESIFSGQPTYNGVAMLTRSPATDVLASLPGSPDEQRRFIAASIGGVRVVNVYVPNGQEVGSDKFRYKLEWLAALRTFLKDDLCRYPELAIVGDFNVAPDERDVHDPKLWEGQVLFSKPEREAFATLVATGLRDAFRKFETGAGHYTWWDYRQAAFRRNLGLRIDHILLSRPLFERCTSCAIDAAPRRNERPSDHVPVIAEV